MEPAFRFGLRGKIFVEGDADRSDSGGAGMRNDALPISDKAPKDLPRNPPRVDRRRNRRRGLGGARCFPRRRRRSFRLARDHHAGRVNSRRHGGHREDRRTPYRLEFDNVPLADALAEFNRYSKTPVLAQSAAVSARRISGVFQVGDSAGLRQVCSFDRSIHRTPSSLPTGRFNDPSRVRPGHLEQPGMPPDLVPTPSLATSAHPSGMPRESSP